MVFCVEDFSWLSIGIVLICGFVMIKRVLQRLQVPGLEQKAVFITGCDSGFGREAALKFSRIGCPVYAGCLTDEGLRSIEDEAKNSKFSGRLVGIPLDVREEESVEKAVKLVRDDLPNNTRLWALLNNAGIFSTYGPAEWCSIDEYRTAMEVNFYGAVRCTRAFLPLIKETKGRVGFTSSVSGRLGTPGASTYSAAKFALAGYCEAIAGELATFKIQIGLFEPGVFKTPLLDQSAKERRVNYVWNKMPQELRDEYGEDYKEKFLKNWHKFMDTIGSTNTSRVTDSYVHFVTTRFPSYNNVCGIDANFFWIPLSYLPSDWTRAMWTRLSHAIPAALQKRKYD
ncbi:hypothetical protein M3Y94_00113300 [Aphelenchoides besseyi]|nr:hypothetical protein M3Y94_00113300 [Aphelenchoides besseyi]KAI6237480.1 CBN-DHS-20 protein [Aphelenchoides besseyi]